MILKKKQQPRLHCLSCCFSIFYLCGLIKKSNILIGLLYKTKGMIFGLIYCSILYFGLLYRTITGCKRACIEVHKYQKLADVRSVIRIPYPIMCKEPFRIRKKLRKIFPSFSISKKHPQMHFFSQMDNSIFNQFPCI